MLINTTKKKLELNKETNKPLCAIVGPEGDFSEKERELILNSGKPSNIVDKILAGKMKKYFSEVTSNEPTNHCS